MSSPPLPDYSRSLLLLCSRGVRLNIFGFKVTTHGRLTSRIPALESRVSRLSTLGQHPSDNWRRCPINANSKVPQKETWLHFLRALFCVLVCFPIILNPSRQKRFAWDHSEKMPRPSAVPALKLSTNVDKTGYFTDPLYDTVPSNRSVRHFPQLHSFSSHSFWWLQVDHQYKSNKNLKPFLTGRTDDGIRESSRLRRLFEVLFEHA